MTRNSVSVILIIITALMLIALVYVYYERQIHSIEEEVMKIAPG